MSARADYLAHAAPRVGVANARRQFDALAAHEARVARLARDVRAQVGAALLMPLALVAGIASPWCGLVACAALLAAVSLPTE